MKIQFLKLFSPQVEAQRRFYERVLELPVRKFSEERFQVKAGYSVLEFEQQDGATPYHVAFHIPALQVEKAAGWLEERLEVLGNGNEKIIDFPAWKARSVYFYDADNNILEFISREHMFKPVNQDFSAESICGISEIGLATSNVEDKYSFLNEQFGLSKFTGDYENFCATGDDEGLFIVINKEQKDWIPTGDKAYASPFEIKISVQNAFFGTSFKNDTLRLL